MDYAVSNIIQNILIPWELRLFPYMEEEIMKVKNEPFLIYLILYSILDKIYAIPNDFITNLGDFLKKVEFRFGWTIDVKHEEAILG